MADKNVSLNTFPSTKTQALTMLFLENQDLSNVSPEQLADLYKDTYGKIAARTNETRKKLV